MSSLERKMAHVAQLLKLHKSNSSVKSVKLPPIPRAFTQLPTSTPRDGIPTPTPTPTVQVSMAAGPELAAVDRKVDIFYCYQCFTPAAGEPVWVQKVGVRVEEGVGVEEGDVKQFCSWECQLTQETEIARIKKRRSEIFLLEICQDLPEISDSSSGGSSSPCVSPLHELTILRIK